MSPAGRCFLLGLAGVLATLALPLGALGTEPTPAPLKQAPDGRHLVLTFSDEFDTFQRWGEGGGRWRTVFGDGTQEGLDRRSLPTNGELELYVDPEVLGLNPFSAHDGTLTITAVPTPPELKRRLRDYAYLSGLITTQPSFAQAYGYFEIRAKLPGGKGIWPAFWLLPADQTWPPEIDVMEAVGDPTHIYMTTHSKAEKARGVEVNITPNEFHRFAVGWDEKEVIWYVDGQERGRQPTPSDMHKPMFLLANLAVGGTWPGNPDSTTHFPAQFVIDYIRAYRYAP